MKLQGHGATVFMTNTQSLERTAEHPPPGLQPPVREPEFPPHAPVRPVRTPGFLRLDPLRGVHAPEFLPHALARPVRDREFLPPAPGRRVRGPEFLRLALLRRVQDREFWRLDRACQGYVGAGRCGATLRIVMNSLKIPYPSEVLWALQKEPDEFEAEARLLLALKLYETGKLSTGLAAKLAGVPRVTFLFLLGQHGLSPFGEEPDELERDLANARQARRPQ